MNWEGINCQEVRVVMNVMGEYERMVTYMDTRLEFCRIVLVISRSLDGGV